MADNSHDNYLAGERAKARPFRSVVDPVPVLDAAESVRVEVDILKESYERILDLLQQEELDLDEGLRTVLLSGLGYMDATLQLGGINRAVARGSEQEAQRIEGLVQDLASYHSMYSVLKYKTFKLYKLSQKLELNVAGLRAAEEMWAEWAERMRRERAEMQAEILKLRALISEFNIDVTLPPTSVRHFPPVEPPEVTPEEAIADPEPLIPDAPDVVEPTFTPNPTLWQRIKGLLGL